MLETALAGTYWLEMAATVTSAISGAMSASREKFDLFGTMALAFIVGLCGGVIRDVLLQDYGIYAFQNPELIMVCIVCGIAVFYFGRLVSYLDPLLDVIDSVQAGLWAVVGASKALSAGLAPIPAAMMGLVTAIGGGIVRDILLNRPIASFQPSQLYGTAAGIGSVIYVLMRGNHVLDGYSGAICIVFVVALRYISIIFNIRTTASRDLTVPIADAITKPVRSLKNKSMLARSSIYSDADDATVPMGSARYSRENYSTRSFNKQKNSKVRHRHRMRGK